MSGPRRGPRQGGVGGWPLSPAAGGGSGAQLRPWLAGGIGGFRKGGKKP